MATTALRAGSFERSDDYMTLPVNSGATIYGGTLVCVDTDGNAISGVTTGIRVIGIARETVTNSGADGTKTVKVELSNGRRSFLFKNAGSGTVDAGDVGATCYLVDNDTVSMTSTDTIAAGTVTGVSSAGVWVRFAL